VSGVGLVSHDFCAVQIRQGGCGSGPGAHAESCRVGAVAGWIRAAGDCGRRLIERDWGHSCARRTPDERAGLRGQRVDAAPPGRPVIRTRRGRIRRRRCTRPTAQRSSTSPRGPVPLARRAVAGPGAGKAAPGD